MTLWLLLPIEGRPEWDPWYDKAFGFVVRAETEAEARAMADTNGGDETHPGAEGVDHWGRAWIIAPRHPWLDPSRSTCTSLAVNGATAIVMRDFRAA